MTFFRSKTPRPSAADAMAFKPVRLTGQLHTRPDGSGTLKVPLATAKRVAWLFKLPPGATKSFELDAIGVFVWDSLDGKTSVEQVIKRVAARYDLNLRTAQVPTLQFLQTLMKKGLVGVPARKGTKRA